ncbi:MAG: hypothetical protein ACREHE_07320 [Rhizomicrobium sp.]
MIQDKSPPGVNGWNTAVLDEIIAAKKRPKANWDTTEDHAHVLANYFTRYNFVRLHQALKVIPAMAAGETSDMVEVLEYWEVSQ